MRNLGLTVFFFVSASFAFGQLESDTLTFQSSRPITLQPDQVVFNVSVTSSLDATLDQVVASLQGSGITAADLSGVFGSLENPLLTTSTGLSWSFTLDVPLTKLKGTVASLTALQMSLAKNGGASLTFQVQRTQVSSELTQAQPCSLKDLVADAQVQAQKLAAAAGLFVGPILAISDGSSVGGPSLVQYAVSGTPALVRSVSVIPNPLFALQSISAPTPFTCTASVKFKLLH
jgi:uncharacterized protein YggE